MEISLLVKKNAQKGLLMHKRGFEGGTPTEWRRAKQLAFEDELDDHTVVVMKAWFGRHEYSSYPGYLQWKQDGCPMIRTKTNRSKYRGAVAWLLWGGDPGQIWLNKIQIQ